MTDVAIESSTLVARVDPRHGAEVVSLEHRPTGTSILAMRPDAPAAPRGGDLSETDWTDSYHGGWQLGAPNAGNACSVGDAEHGFHGRASVDPWEIVRSDPASIELTWSGHGLRANRRYVIAGDVMTAETTWEAAGDTPAPMVHLEHLILGPPLVGPDTQVVLGTSRPGPGGVQMLPAPPVDRFRCLGPVEVGMAEAWSPDPGIGVQLTWLVEDLPYLWIWHQHGAPEGIWGERTQVLGIEPASVPDDRGLANAIEAGTATWVSPGRPVTRSLSLRVVTSSAATHES